GTPGVDSQTRPARTPAARYPDVPFTLHLPTSGLGMLLEDRALPLYLQHTPGGLERRLASPAAPHRFAERRGDFGGQTDPPGSMRHRLDPVQPTGLAPSGNCGDGDVKRLGGGLGRVPAIAPLPVGARHRSL